MWRDPGRKYALASEARCAPRADSAMNERAVFTEALDRATPEERAAFLERACAGNPALRAQVEALLRTHDRAGDFLGKLAPQRLAEDLAADPGAGGSRTQPAGSPD